MAKVYEILITHKEGECPKLPDCPDFRYMSPDFADWRCPTHQVFQEVCSLQVARWRIDLLKKVKEIERIRLFYGGDVKEQDQWERGTWGRWERI